MDCAAFSSETSCVAASYLFKESGCEWIENHDEFVCVGNDGHKKVICLS